MIEKSILLACDAERAFRLFTAGISQWWPPERRHLPDPESVIVLSHERFFERDAAGNEVELGRVLSWEPPHRLILDWYPGTDREHPTRVEVVFQSEASATRVRVQHSGTDKSQELFPTRAPRYDASWDLVLAAFSRAAAGQ